MLHFAKQASFVFVASVITNLLLLKTGIAGQSVKILVLSTVISLLLSLVVLKRNRDDALDLFWVPLLRRSKRYKLACQRMSLIASKESKDRINIPTLEGNLFLQGPKLYLLVDRNQGLSLNDDMTSVATDAFTEGFSPYFGRFNRYLLRMHGVRFEVKKLTSHEIIDLTAWRANQAQATTQGFLPPAPLGFG